MRIILDVIDVTRRPLALLLALFMAFGYVFFLSSQSDLTTAHTLTTFVLLMVFALANKEWIASKSGLRFLVSTLVLSSILTALKVRGDIYFFEGPQLSAAGFRLVVNSLPILWIWSSRELCKLSVDSNPNNVSSEPDA